MIFRTLILFVLGALALGLVGLTVVWDIEDRAAMHGCDGGAS